MDEDFNVVAAADADDDYSEKSWPNLPTAFSMFSSIPGSSSGSSRTSERKKEKNKNKKNTCRYLLWRQMSRDPRPRFSSVATVDFVTVSTQN